MTAWRDLLAFTVGAVAARTVLPAGVQVDGIGHPGAALIAACERHPALLADYNQNPEAVEDGPEDRAMRATFELIRDAKPQTMAGVIAKARAGKAEAIGPDSEDCIDFTCMGGVFAWGMVNDLLRLAGVEA